MTRLYLRADDFDGAGQALARVELDMPTRKLMEYLDNARNAKKSARHAIVTWFVGVCLALLLIGLAVRLRLTGLMAG